MEFENAAFLEYEKWSLERSEQSLPLRANIMFAMFPFSIVFAPDTLKIAIVGTSLRMMMPDIVGQLW